MEIHINIKIHWQQFKNMHARKSGAMEKTGLIPRFEIIGRFNLTNVPHAISRWTTYERHDGKMYSFKNKKNLDFG